jgi:hypothetical protein
MANEQITAPTPQAQTPAAPQAPAAPPQSTATAPSDIFKRTSQVQAPAEAPASQEVAPPQVNISLDDIKDPVQRGIVQKHLEAKLKEANNAISKTFGELGGEKARLMKQVKELEGQIEQVRNKSYSATDIQQLINRPDFVQAVQTYQQQSAPEGWNRSTEEWSALSDNDKQLVQQAIAEARSTRNQLNSMQLSSYHQTLRTQYPDYNPNEVEEVINRANSGQMTQQEIFELTYKALKAEDKVRQAYKMGWEDRNTNITEKVGGMSMNGVQTNVSPDALERNPNEPTRSFFKRIAERNLSRLQK